MAQAEEYRIEDDYPAEGSINFFKSTPQRYQSPPLHYGHRHTLRDIVRRRGHTGGASNDGVRMGAYNVWASLLIDHRSRITTSVSVSNSPTYYNRGADQHEIFYDILSLECKPDWRVSEHDVR